MDEMEHLRAFWRSSRATGSSTFRGGRTRRTVLGTSSWRKEARHWSSASQATFIRLDAWVDSELCDEVPSTEKTEVDDEDAEEERVEE